MSTKKLLRRRRIRYAIRKRLSGTSERPRLSVFRSNKFVYAQLIDDVVGKTLVSASISQLEDKVGTKTEVAQRIGKKIAELALAQGISAVVFDRGGYLYHGRVKALAEGAREGGLKF